MEKLVIEGTDVSPTIILDNKNGIFEISGFSMVENAAEFYEPVLKWLDHYKHHHNDTTEFNFKLEHFNTTSSRQILDILITMREIRGSKIYWYFHEQDEDCKKVGEEMAEFLNTEFVFKEY